MKRICTFTAGLALLLMVVLAAPCARAQDDDDVMSQKEIETLRDSAYVPNDRIAAFIRILDTREQEIEQLLSKPHRPGFTQDMHDFIDQFGAIADELNDNLDEYQNKHRDIRKSLPKLISSIERWSTTLRAPSDDDGYNVVRRIALDSLKDMRETATSTQTEQAEYFKAHPDAAKMEKDRADPNHAPVQEDNPH
jgi:hypothetical protein